MSRVIVAVAALFLVLAVPTVEVAAAPAHPIRDLSLELVGQYVNSPPGVTPPTHTHYGYLSYVRGMNAFKAAPGDETTALFTFSAEAATLRVVTSGPLRVVTRTGTITIYHDPTPNGNFGDPSTFRDGAPVLVATFRQQSIVDTVSGTFNTFHQNRIVSSRPFAAGKSTVQLGVVHETFTTVFHGHTNMPGPPSGWFAGYAVSG